MGWDVKIPVMQTVLAAALWLAPACDAHSQEGAAAPASECVMATPPAKVTIHPPVEPAKPACAAINKCSKQVAEKFNAEIVFYNNAIAKANEALGDYVEKLNDYARGAGRYSNCEITRLNNLMVK